MCRKKISPFPAQDRFLPVSPPATDCFPNHGSFQRRPSTKNPNALFLIHRGLAPHRTQNDVILERLHLQGLSGFNLQLLANGLRKYETSRSIDAQSGIHNGILPYHLPFTMPFRPYPKSKGTSKSARPSSFSVLNLLSA